MKISCIIPSYNEASRIVNVVRTLSSHPLVYECIIVDDGSSDNTEEVLKNYSNIRYIKHHKNRGKSAAICTGIEASSGEYLLFIDADLVGLEMEHVTALITPILENNADVSISLRKNTPWLWRLIGLDYLSGERMIPKDLLQKEIDSILALPGFGLETFIDDLIVKNKMSIKIVDWPEVQSPWKHSKKQVTGFTKIISTELPMMRDILRTASLPKIIFLIIKMRQLRIS